MHLASFFDIDGTLIEGHMIYEFPKHLVKIGLFGEKIFEKIDNWIQLYSKNSVTYRKIALIIPDLYSKGMKNLEVKIIKEQAKKFVDDYTKKFLRPYTRKLTELMKHHGLTIGISGSPIEVVGYFGKIFNFNTIYGTELEIKDEVYTGKLKQNLIIRETKEIVLEKIIKENKINLNKSFGFGDTEQDLSFLSKVGNPVALNPNQELLSVAQKNSWMVFRSDDDIINEINKRVIELKSD